MEDKCLDHDRELTMDIKMEQQWSWFSEAQLFQIGMCDDIDTAGTADELYPSKSVISSQVRLNKSIGRIVEKTALLIPKQSRYKIYKHNELWVNSEC